MSWRSQWLVDAVGELPELMRSDRRRADRIYRAVEMLARSSQVSMEIPERRNVV